MPPRKAALRGEVAQMKGMRRPGIKKLAACEKVKHEKFPDDYQPIEVLKLMPYKKLGSCALRIKNDGVAQRPERIQEALRGRQRGSGRREELNGIAPLNPLGELHGRQVEQAAQVGHGPSAKRKSVARLEQSSAAGGRDVTRCPCKHACATQQLFLIYLWA